MRLTNIHIENFRCFESYDITFGSSATVLIGKNGSGKTTLIQAITSAVSFIFSKYTAKNQHVELLGNTPDLHLVTLTKTDAYFDSENQIYKYPISIACQANFQEELLDWSIYKETANGKLHEVKYRDAFMAFTEYYNRDLKKSSLPLLTFFSDSYPHKRTNIGSYAKSVLTSGRFSRAFGYYQWDAESSCAEIWQNRYVAQYSKITDFKNTEQETQQERAEIAFIDDKIKTFTAPLRPEFGFINKEFQVNKINLARPLKDKVYIQFVFEDNRKILFEHLPQGYNRLLSIVFDIAYRSYILNNGEDSEGIVFIDEIELHLHPTLQQEVLERFQKTFPKIQFIVSTHSPLVISNLKADGQVNKIIKLEHEGDFYENEEVSNVFGIDYTTNLVEVMGSDYRSSTIDKYINAYLFLWGKNKINEAEEMKERLRKYVGGAIPELLEKEIETQKSAYL
jgi:predicted ATP-binding protein involved in virulence